MLHSNAHLACVNNESAQPDNHEGNENCAEMVFGDSTVNDDRCTVQQGFICKFVNSYSCGERST